MSEIRRLVGEHCTRSVSCSPHGPLYPATWASSLLSGWILGPDGPRDRNWELPVLYNLSLERNIGHFCHIVLVKVTHSRGKEIDIAFNERVIKEFAAIFSPVAV